jgi:hypothetical protein
VVLRTALLVSLDDLLAVVRQQAGGGLLIHRV